MPGPGAGWLSSGRREGRRVGLGQGRASLGLWGPEVRLCRQPAGGTVDSRPDPRRGSLAPPGAQAAHCRDVEGGGEGGSFRAPSAAVPCSRELAGPVTRRAPCARVDDRASGSARLLGAARSGPREQKVRSTGLWRPHPSVTLPAGDRVPGLGGKNVPGRAVGPRISGSSGEQGGREPAPFRVQAFHSLSPG